MAWPAFLFIVFILSYATSFAGESNQALVANLAITLVSLPNDDTEFIFERMGGWLYLGTTFMGPEEFESSQHEGQLNRFLLELQHRNLGCRFSYDSAGFLTIGGELDPERQQPADVLQMLEQILFIIESCIHLCDQVLDSGRLPSDREVDEVFGINENLH